MAPNSTQSLLGRQSILQQADKLPGHFDFYKSCKSLPVAVGGTLICGHVPLCQNQKAVVMLTEILQ